jgi:ectoine hydroxylase-related dioxygenase (phytanoyl-CoA dioxygenase family)
LENRPEFAEIGNALREYFGGGNILNMQIFIKHPHYKITAPHQDGAYFEPNKNIVTFWMPTQKITEQNSCLYYKPGSHKQGLREHTKSGTTIRTRTGKTGYSLECYEEKLEDFVPVLMEVGDVLVHDQFTLHYSSTNHTEEKRMAVTCILELDNI